MDQPLCTHYTGGACCVNLLTEELGIQVEVVIGPAQILYSILPSFRTGPVFVQKELYLIIFVGHLNLRQPKNYKSKRNISAINCRFCRAF